MTFVIPDPPRGPPPDHGQHCSPGTKTHSYPPRHPPRGNSGCLALVGRNCAATLSRSRNPRAALRLSDDDRQDGITDHFTPLMAACSHDDLALVEALIAAGAKVNYDEALIGGALIGGAHRALIAAGANVNANGGIGWAEMYFRI